MSLISLTQEVLAPYKSNRNTGNRYEILVVLTLLRKMGLTNEDLTICAPLFQSIRDINGVDAIDTPLEKVKTIPVGTGLIFDGMKMISMKNVTQDDGDGKTGDLLLITDTGSTYSLSICEGKVKRDKSVEKCLTNPSAKRCGATEEDIKRIQTRQAQAVTEYIKEFQQKYGVDESIWPSRVRTTVATDAAADVASWMAERFTGLSLEQKEEIFRDLLRIDSISTRPADYLALVDKTNMTPIFYKFDEPVFSVWEPTMEAQGIWLLLKNQGKPIGKIQVKFNNGVYHKGKTSSLYSSWNLTCNLTDVFALKSTSVRF